jgi:DNA-binding SARP family transcriptional activator
MGYGAPITTRPSFLYPLLDLALRSGLHRLRKLLGREDAVVLRDGHLSLNERVVWVDVWAVQALLEPLSEGLHRELMRMHADNGDFAEALVVYEHRKKTLSLNFGVPPGAATAQLYEAIRERIADR